MRHSRNTVPSPAPSPTSRAMDLFAADSESSGKESVGPILVEEAGGEFGAVVGPLITVVPLKLGVVDGDMLAIAVVDIGSVVDVSEADTGGPIMVSKVVDEEVVNVGPGVTMVATDSGVVAPADVVEVSFAFIIIVNGMDLASVLCESDPTITRK